MADDILSVSDKLRSSIIERLLEAIPDYEKKILGRVLQLLDEYESKNGKFVIEKASRRKLLQIHSEILDILRKSGYFKAANIYVADLKKLTENVRLLHEGFNKIDLTRSSLTGIERIFAERAVNLLSGGGLNEHFVLPVTTIVNEAITFGYSIQSTRDSLKDFITGNEDKSGKLKSYLTTTARDIVTQLQGAQHQAISNEFKMPFLRYVGTLLKDSRGQCVRWKNMEYIPIEELQSEIDLAFKNQKARLVFPKGHRWGGMIEGTTPENFLIRRGGWGCLHNAIPVRSKGKAAPKLDDVTNKIKSQNAASLKKLREDYKVNVHEDLFKYLKQPIEIGTSNKKEAYFNPSENKLVIGYRERWKRSRYSQETVMAHELAHAIHNQNEIITSTYVRKDYADHFRSLQEIIKGKEREIHDALFAAIVGTEDNDKLEQIGVLFDILGSLTRGKYGGGHPMSYYRNYNGAEKEIFAHSMSLLKAENKYLNLAPELKKLADAMTEYLSNVLKSIVD